MTRMSCLLDNLKLKTVQKEDYAAVIKIRENVYGGLDYLPACFNQLVDAPNSRPFAAVLNNRIVAFTIAFIVDDGQTWIVRANRVVKDLEGRGIMTWLKEKVNDILKRTTSVQYQVYTTIDVDQTAVRHIKQGIVYPVAKMKVIDFICGSQHSKISMLRRANDNVKARILDSEDVGQIFDSQDMTDHLFRKQRLVVDFVPFKPIRSNLPYILHGDNVTVVGSRLESIEHTLLTFCHLIPTQNGLLYFIDAFGNIEDNLATHIIQHLDEEQNSRYGNEFVIRLVYDEDIKYENISRKMTEISFSTKVLPFESFLCVEKKLS